jgi:exopolysaccharide biosynthesis WecB/TagA/CpsF family protein
MTGHLDPATTKPATVPLTIDALDLEQFVEVAARYGSDDLGFVVTPNVDHMIRYRESAEFRAFYADAAYVLLDSQFASTLVRLLYGLRIPVCKGSDLTDALFSRVIQADDVIVLVGASSEQADTLRQRYGLRKLLHHNPPMGFADDPQAVEAVLDFIESASPFRYCLMAVGSPRQEMVSRMLVQRARARGLVLCIGASINFLTGGERRAPQWMQRCGLEWLYRLLQDPRRLAHRYLVRGPRFFVQLSRDQLLLRQR